MNFARRSTKLYLYDFEKGSWTEWANDPDGISYPTWSSDGKFVHYANLYSGTNIPSYNRVKLGSKAVERLFSIPNANPYATNIGPWTGLTPEGSMMYTRDVSSQNGYQLDVEFP